MRRLTEQRTDARSGAALVLVLWVIAILSMLVLSFAFDAHLEAKMTSFYRKRRKAEYLANSGMTIATMLLNKQTEVKGNETAEETADDRWYEPALRLSRGQPVQGLVESLGDGEIVLTIEPEPGRRNINTLYDTDWERILEVGGIPEELWPALIDSFNDWIDADDTVRQDGGETEDYYASLEKPYEAKNGPVDTVQEVLLVKGFSEAILSGGVLNPDEKDEAARIVVSGIEDMLTTYGDGKVNVNAAGIRVLMTLPGVDELIAHAIIEEREGGKNIDGTTEDTSFESVSDFMGRIPDLDAGVKDRVTTKSSYFRVTCVGKVGRVTRRIWAIVYHSGKEVRALRWREEP